MKFQCVFWSSWICLLLLCFGACAPARKGQRLYQPGPGAVSSSSGGVSFGFGRGSGLTSGGIFSGAAANVGTSAAQDAGISQMIAGLMGLSPYDRRPLLQFHWSSPQVPLDMVDKRPVFPSSLIHSNNGYQRARDFRSDSKYTKETFDNIPQPGRPQNPDSGSKGHQKS